MRIQANSIIAGQPALEIRKLFKNIHEHGSIDGIAKALNVNLEAAQRIQDQLFEEEYIEFKDEFSTETKYWHTTIKGNALINASARKPISRKTAEKIVAQFLGRVKDVNNNDYAYYVTKVIIFGSYLSNSSTLGDVDFAIDLEFRTEDIKIRREFLLKRAQIAREQGKSFRNFSEEIGWAQTEILRILKAHSSSISLHIISSEKEFLESIPTKTLLEFNRNQVNLG